MPGRAAARLAAAVALLALAAAQLGASEVTPVMSEERVVFQTEYGDIEWGFWPEVAPVTCEHIFTLVRLGLYTSNHIFRVDKGFVAQTADVIGGRTVPMSEEQLREARKNVPLEVKEGVKHHEGVLSMGRYDDPNTGTSSFSMLLGDAPHLDMQYTIFAKVTRGMDVLHKLEELPTKREGIFVMPLKRITILSTYWYRVNRPAPALTLPGAKVCDDELNEMTQRFASQAEELQRVRKKCLPA